MKNHALFNSGILIQCKRTNPTPLQAPLEAIIHSLMSYGDNSIHRGHHHVQRKHLHREALNKYTDSINKALLVHWCVFLKKNILLQLLACLKLLYVFRRGHYIQWKFPNFSLGKVLHFVQCLLWPQSVLLGSCDALKIEEATAVYFPKSWMPKAMLLQASGDAVRPSIQQNVCWCQTQVVPTVPRNRANKPGMLSPVEMRAMCCWPPFCNPMRRP